jgi:hypothetical protein
MTRNIGDMVRAMVAERVPREPANPDGGLGGLTDDELQPFNDLLNAEYPCECGVDGCNSPLPIDPTRGPL